MLSRFRRKSAGSSAPWWRAFFAACGCIPVDAPYVQVAAPAPESTDTEQEQPKPERAGDFQSQPVTQPMDLDLEEDFEFKRLKAMYRLLKDCGYTLRITKQEETVLTPREDSASTLPKAA